MFYKKISFLILTILINSFIQSSAPANFVIDTIRTEDDLETKSRLLGAIHTFLSSNQAHGFFPSSGGVRSYQHKNTFCARISNNKI